MKINQAIILVGGLGSRLGAITTKTPKPLIRINNKPFLDYVINYLIKYKFNKIILLTKFKHELFFKKYHNKIINNAKIKCINQKKFYGTAGSLKNVINKLDKRFLLCNGDTFFEINLFDLIKKFSKQYIGVLGCSEIQKSLKRYTSFSHKDRKLISSGVYLFDRDKIKKFLSTSSSLENEVLKRLPKKSFKKIGYKKKFLDIGTPKDLRRSSLFLEQSSKKKCVFLDRDGVINYDLGYVHKKENFFWKKKVPEAIKLLNDNDFYVIIISNQSGVGRGYYKIQDVDTLHEWVNTYLHNKGCFIDKFYYSPYYKFSKQKKFRVEKNLRKPNIGMFNKAVRQFKIIKKNSYFIGDKDTDAKAAKKFNIKYFNVDNKTNLYNLVKKYITRK
jgi:D-glycero-D-manno-heptose 1,7-bisphosphate phosphatase